MRSDSNKLYNRSFLTLSVANLLMATGFYFLLPTLPVFVTDILEGTPAQVGYIISVFTLSALIVRLFTGYALDRFGRKYIYLVSFGCFSLMLGLYSWIHIFLFLLAIRFIHGASWGAATTAASTVVIDISPAGRRGEAIGIYGLSFTLAMAVAPATALYITERLGFDLMFIWAMLISTLGLVLVMTVRFPVYIKPEINKKLSWHNLVAPKSIPMALIQLLFGLTYGGLLSFITLYASEKGMGDPGIFFLLFAAGIAGSRIVSGKIFDAYGPKKLIISGLLSGASGFIVLSLLPTYPGFLGSGILIGICMGVTMPTLQAMANNVVEPNMRGAANATFITAFDIGIGGGSFLLGLLADASGLEMVYLFSGAINIASLVVYLAYSHPFYRRNYN